MKEQALGGFSIARETTPHLFEMFQEFPSEVLDVFENVVEFRPAGHQVISKVPPVIRELLIHEILRNMEADGIIAPDPETPSGFRAKYSWAEYNRLSLTEKARACVQRIETIASLVSEETSAEDIGIAALTVRMDVAKASELKSRLAGVLREFMNPGVACGPNVCIVRLGAMVSLWREEEGSC